MDPWAPVVRYGPDGIGQLVAEASAFQTVSGRFRCTATTTDTAAHGSAEDVWADAYGELTIPINPVGSAAIVWGIRLRVADNSNHYLVRLEGTGGLRIFKVVAGVSTELFAVANTLGAAAPSVFRAEVQGDILRGFWRGRLLGSFRDTTFQAPGFVSMFLRASTAVSDIEASCFEAGPLTASYAAPSGPAQLPTPSMRRRLGR